MLRTAFKLELLISYRNHIKLLAFLEIYPL